ncbi:MAG: GGDEF domain-containing protein [Sulfurimonas sp.]|nr:GGDEF domain-containing protein [Sulfurimonas sp.]
MKFILYLLQINFTSLPNRTQLNYDLDSKKPHTLMLIDIDRFSLLNDAYGFDVGDQVLIHMGQVLSKVLRRGMTIYRLESDLFAILVAVTHLIQIY